MIRLFKKKGDISDYVDAVIKEDGDLQLIRNSFGPGSFETEVTASIRKKDKDRLLLALLERLYGGNKSAVEDFTEFARSKGLTVNWFRWP